MYESEMQEDQIPYPIQPQFSVHSSEGSIRFQLGFDDIIESIEHTLRCEEEKINTQTGEVTWVTPEDSVPLINKKGMVRIKTILRSKLNRNAPLSDLEDDEIKEICKEVERNVIHTLHDNWDTFEIPDVSAASTIRETIGDAVFINLKKAKYGAFLRHLRSTSHTSEVSTINGQPQPQQTNTRGLPIVDKLFGRKR